MVKVVTPSPNMGDKIDDAGRNQLLWYLRKHPCMFYMKTGQSTSPVHRLYTARSSVSKPFSYTMNCVGTLPAPYSQIIILLYNHADYAYYIDPDLGSSCTFMARHVLSS